MSAIGDLIGRVLGDGRRIASMAVAVVVVVSLSGLAPASASAADGSGYGVESFALEPLGLPTSFGLEGEPLGQEPFIQAGGHPFSLTTSIALDSTPYKADRLPTGSPKDIVVKLPPGVVGDPTAVPKCTRWATEKFLCPQAAQVGTMQITMAELVGSPKKNEVFTKPLYNMVPPEGYAAAFGVRFNNFANAFIYAKVRTGEDYGVNAESLNITTLATVIAVKVTIWGVPGNPAHNDERYCLNPEGEGHGYKEPKWCAEHGEEQALPEHPFLDNPTSCASGPLPASMFTDSYEEPGIDRSASTQIPAMAQCATVPFEPSIETRPTTGESDSPTGLNIDLHIPQDEEPEGQASADLKNATVTFPPGLVVNPSSADGLGACSEEQAGFTGEFKELNPTGEPEVKTPQFTPGPIGCPGSSKLGSVTIDTPLIGHPLTGGLYLARQRENQFGSLLGVYLAVYDEVTGVVIKLPGRVVACQNAGVEQEGDKCAAAGQLTTIFDQNPQLPFEDLKVELPEGPRAALTTPIACGSYATTSLLEPWSHRPTEGEAAGTSDAEPSSPPFQISEAPGGGACASSEGEAPNTPGFEAGTASPIAGSYSPFVLKLTREDGSQRFSGLNVTLPPGLIGKVAGVEQCPQAAIEAAEHRSQAGEGGLELASPSCPAGSEIGTVHVGAGSGAPLYVTGHAYFAGPYEGAPFSIVIVTPAVAGPFDLGTVVVRAALYINQTTAQVTVKSDPIPSVLHAGGDGIPLDIRSIGVDIDRPGFTLNPTSCEAMAVTGKEASTVGQTADLSDRFQAGSCTSLPFHPSFSVSTQGVTSKKEGASLDVRVVPGAGQANIHMVHVSLPKQLPSRLETLKLACTEAVFAANPAACPEGSKVGTATAITPILANPLTGPAYLVSHGGAAFPDLEIVLQGEGVTLILDGKTNIDEKTGITSSSFESVPDAPVSSFELNLPEGSHSVLAAPGGKLCQEKLVMPTRIVGQNGAVIEQSTQIAVTGCPKSMVKKVVPLTRAQKLAKALKACRSKNKGKSARKRRERTACEKQARRRYGPVVKKKKKKK